MAITNKKNKSLAYQIADDIEYISNLSQRIKREIQKPIFSNDSDYLDILDTLDGKLEEVIDLLEEKSEYHNQ